MMYLNYWEAIELELLQLRYFLDSAKNGNFSKTAEKYMVPTSSVSASIRRLEKELGQKLFTRTANRVTLNDNGRRLLASADKILSELEQAVNDITNPPDKRVIRILVLSYRHPITNMIIEYRTKHPGVFFDLCIDHSVTDHSDYDIIIGTSDLDLRDYAHFDLCSCRIYFQVAEDHPLCGKVLTLAQLSEQPFVTMGGNMHKVIVNACERAGFTPNIIAKINDTTCYKKFMKTGDVIGHRRDLGYHPSPGMDYLNVTDFKEYQNIRVYYKEASVNGSIKNFLEFLKTKAK